MTYITLTFRAPGRIHISLTQVYPTSKCLVLVKLSDSPGCISSLHIRIATTTANIAEPARTALEPTLFPKLQIKFADFLQILSPTMMNYTFQRPDADISTIRFAEVNIFDKKGTSPAITRFSYNTIIATWRLSNGIAHFQGSRKETDAGSYPLHWHTASPLKQNIFPNINRRDFLHSIIIE